MKQELEAIVNSTVQSVFGVEVNTTLTRPDERFGDYATNVAMQLAGQLQKNPREIAETLANALNDVDMLAEVSVAGAGFLNLWLNDATLLDNAHTQPSAQLSGQRILLEYSCPNAFKELHTGHLYQTAVGDALGRLFEASGAKVFRANFGGDVGLHVAKCLYGILQVLGGPEPEKLAEVPDTNQASWISAAYVLGAKAYEDDAEAKTDINELNKQIYAFHNEDDHDSPLARIYWTCREWSYQYFKDFYNTFDVEPFDKYYPESQTTKPGLDLVRAHQDVFTESDGAIVYKGEKKGLHTRVFITSVGIPTYEAKDLGVIVTEIEDFPYDARIIMTGNDQAEYMKVVFAALADIDTVLANKQTHLTNGTVKFADGKKMSSRLGNVTRARDVLEVVNDAVKELTKDPELRHEITLGAVKYSFLKHRLGGDIAFDISESVSLQGNSGPYLQYAHARAQSILRKANHPKLDLEASQEKSAEGTAIDLVPALAGVTLEADERSLVRKLTEYSEVIDKAITERMPHHIATYLYELAQAFNRFYEHNRVIGDNREAIRLNLVSRYTATLKDGLSLLGITAPDRM